MPKLPTDYLKTIIYKFTCLDKTIEYTYVGSTTNFTQRKRQHKSDCNNEKGKKYYFKLYSTIRENGNWENWTMVQIEEYPCNNNREAECREEYWRVELNSQLNMRQAFTTKEERNEQYKQYRENLSQEKKEEKNQYNRKYREEHKEELKEQQKQYYEEHREANKEANRQRAKEYYEKHKEEIKEANRQRERRTLKKQLLQENK